jgi:hypothetical protein
MSTVSKLEQQIRDFINNNPRTQHGLLQDAAAWSMLCSCLDTIGDIETALDAYEQSSDPSEIGTRYLLVYGTLQALFIQQDAVTNLCEALAITYQPEPLLRNIREIRNDSVGHPTKRDRKKGEEKDKLPAYNFISRSSLRKDGFSLMTVYPGYPSGSPPSFQSIRIPALIATQRNLLEKTLSEVLEKMRKEEADHRARYRDQRLQDIFHSTLGYYFQKIYEAIHGTHGEFGFGAGHDVRLIASIIEDFKGSLKERGILEAYDPPVGYLLDLLEYPVRELGVYFSGQGKSAIDSKGAYIFTFFIEKHMDELKSIAEEIDKEYASEP